MPYGQIKVDEITFTNAGVDQTISVSGVVASISGNITATGTISGDVIRGGTLVSGATVTGTAGQFGTITGNTAGFTTVTGTTVTGTTAQFTTVTGGTAGFTTITGTTVTGTAANFVTVSGTTVTGNVGNFTTVTGGTVTLTSGVFGAGTASLPSISFTGDLNTGIYSPGADQVAVATNGTGRLFVDSSGRVGVGASSPSRQFQVNNASGSAFASVVSANTSADVGYLFGTTSSDALGQIIYDNSTNSLRIATNSSERVRITSAGLVGIGVTAPEQLLHIGGNNGIRFGNAAATPKADISYTSSGDEFLDIKIQGTTTGYGNIRFSTGPTPSERARIDSSGRLLVGTSSARSNIYNTTYAPQIQLEGNDNANSALSIISCFNGTSIGGQLILGKANSGSVGVNGIVANGNPIGRLSFQGNDGSEFVEGACIEAQVDGTPGANDMPGRLVFSVTRDGQSSPEEKIRVTNDGHTIFKPTTGNGTISLANNETAFIPDASYGQTLRFANTFGGGKGFCNFTTNGIIVGTIQASGTTGTSYNTSSDYRLKENVTSVPDGITRLQQLKPSRFNFIAEPNRSVDGFIAHEAQAVVPECVTGEKDAVDADGNPIYQGIDQSKLVPLLTAALQEAIGEIESLKARVVALESA